MGQAFLKLRSSRWTFLLHPSQPAMAPKAKGLAAKNLSAALAKVPGANMPELQSSAALQLGNIQGRAILVLVKKVAAIANVSAKDAKSCLDALRLVSARELRESGKFRFPSWFVFNLKLQSERDAKVKKNVDGEIVENRHTPR